MDVTRNSIDDLLKKTSELLEKHSSQAQQQAKEILLQSELIRYHLGTIKASILLSRTHWHLMEYDAGLKAIKSAHKLLQNQESDDLLPEVLHIYALQYWGKARHFSAQQYWINALEQASLTGNIHIELEALIGLGNIWRITDELELAKNTHKLAADRASKLAIYSLAGKASILLAWDKYLLADYLGMLSTLDVADAMLIHWDDPTWQAEIYDFRGVAYLGLNRLDEAEAFSQKAYDIALTHNLTWMKAHSAISQARVAQMKQNFVKATELLTLAETTAKTFDKGELLSQISLLQSKIAEQTHDYEQALIHYKRFRAYEIDLLQEQTSALGRDKTNNSKKRLDMRAIKLINLIRSQLETSTSNVLPYLVPETTWWEYLLANKSQIHNNGHHVLLIQHPDHEFLERMITLCHGLCVQGDQLAKLDSTILAILIKADNYQAQQFYRNIQQFLTMASWLRTSHDPTKAKVAQFSVSAFPLTLEQLNQKLNNNKNVA